MNNIKGTKKVFAFTLTQTLKAKSTIVTLFLMVLFALVSVPISAYLNKSQDEENSIADSIDVENIYYFNNTDYKDVDFKTCIKNDSHTSKANLIECDKKDLESKKELVKDEEKNSLILTIDKEDMQYNIKSLRHSKGSINKNEADYISNLLKTTFDANKFSKISGDKELITDLSKPINQDNITFTNDISDKSDDTNSNNENMYVVVYTLILVSFFIITFSSGLIASSVATDKSTRVSEYLMLSVKPLALLTGKILASFCFALIQMLSIVISLTISNIFTSKYISDKSFITNTFSKDLIPNLNVVNIILGVIAILLGLIFYSVLAGLCGSTVSKLEDLKNALTLYNIISILSFYACFFLIGMKIAMNPNIELSSFQKFITLFPLSSPFVLPSMALCGKINLTLSLIGVLILLVVCALFLKFTAKIYTTLIMYNGTKVSPRDFIKIYKGGMKNE